MSVVSILEEYFKTEGCLSKRALSLQIGRSEGYIKDVLGGRIRIPSKADLEQIAVATGIDVAQLLSAQAQSGSQKSIADAIAAAEQGHFGKASVEVLRDLKRFCAARCEAPASIPLTVGALRHRLNELNACRMNMSEKRFNNFQSNVWRAVKLLGTGGTVSRSLRREWSELLAVIPTDAHYRYPLLGFARWCDAEEIKPSDVSFETMKAYAKWHDENALTSKTRAKVMSGVKTSWKKASQTFSVWPQVLIYMEKKSELPSSLSAEVATYVQCERSLQQKARWSHRRRESAAPELSPLKDTTLKRVVASLKRLLEVGLSSHGVKSFQDLFDEQTFDDVVTEIIRADEPETEYARTLARDLLRAARVLNQSGKLRVDDATLEDLSAGVKHWSPRQANEKLRRGMSPRVREKVRAISTYDRARLFRFPRGAIAAIEKERKTNHIITTKMVDEFEVALACQILLGLPLRRQNLVELSLTRDLNIPQTGKANLLIDGSRTKNGEPIGRLWNQEVSDILRLWITNYRPLRLRSQNSEYLFPSPEDPTQPRSPGAFANRITDALWRHLGIEMHLHMFRHIIASELLRENLSNAQLVKTLLGHRDVRTTLEFYADLKTEASSKLVDEALEKLEKNYARKTKTITRSPRRSLACPIAA